MTREELDETRNLYMVKTRKISELIRIVDKCSKVQQYLNDVKRKANNCGKTMFDEINLKEYDIILIDSTEAQMFADFLKSVIDYRENMVNTLIIEEL